MAIDIGRIAFETYQKEMWWGTSLEMLWEDCDKKEQDAWRAAACAVLQYIDEQKNKDEEE